MRHLSLFTGSGIGDYAAEQCGIKTVAQCEIDDCCRYCLGKMFPNAIQFKDVKDVSSAELDRHRLLPVDIISGGFPCTDISCAGKGAGIHGKESGLWFEMRRIIGEVRPQWVLAENVPALRSRGSDRVLSDLEEEGYTCWTSVVGAWAVGAPHKRDRVWIVAHRDESRCERPRPNGGQSDAGADGRDNVGRCRQGTGGSRQPEQTLRPRWPSRRGEPQHDWEAPRLVECGVGSESSRLAGRILDRIGEGHYGISPDRAASRANKSLLRMIGNGWQYDICLLIYRWIIEGLNQ